MSDRYQLKGKIGIGGMARVLLARDNRIGRDIAIKVLHAQFADNKEVQERFITETKTAGQLNHPNIVAIYDVGSDFYREIDGAEQDDLDSSSRLPYLLMEYVPGISFDKLIARSPQPDLRLGFSVCYQICLALQTAHDNGIIHRDVKPSNILVREDGRAKLTDFGIARFMEASTAHNTMAGMGTAAYMSPEQIRGTKIGPTSDIYSLGCTLFAALTGHAPYQMDSFVQMHKHIEEPIPVIHEANPQVPASVNTIIERALAKDSADRYQSALEMAQDLAEQLLQLGGDLPGQSASHSALSGVSALPGASSSAFPSLSYLDISLPGASSIPGQSSVPGVGQIDDPNRSGVQTTGGNRTQLPGLGAPVTGSSTEIPGEANTSNPTGDDSTHLAKPGTADLSAISDPGGSVLPGSSALPGGDRISLGTPSGSALPGKSARPREAKVGASARSGADSDQTRLLGASVTQRLEGQSLDSTQAVALGSHLTKSPDAGVSGTADIVTVSQDAAQPGESGTAIVTEHPANQRTTAVTTGGRTTDNTGAGGIANKSRLSKKVVALLGAAALCVALTVGTGWYFLNSSKGQKSTAGAATKTSEPATTSIKNNSSGNGLKSGFNGWKIGDCLYYDSENDELNKTDCTADHIYEIADLIEFKDPTITSTDKNTWPYGKTQAAAEQCHERLPNIPSHLALTGWDTQIDHNGSYYVTHRLCLLSNFGGSEVNVPSFQDHYKHS